MITQDMPDLTFFVVGTGGGQKHIFCSLEGSLGLLAISSCGIKDASSIDFLLYADAWHFNAKWNQKIYFAETHKSYFIKDSKGYEELKEDYYITKLAGVKQ